MLALLLLQAWLLAWLLVARLVFWPVWRTSPNWVLRLLAPLLPCLLALLPAKALLLLLGLACPLLHLLLLLLA